ncbi:MAG: N-acetyltransferase [Oscillospiraceae bacterium]|nr:N-acetyltransferase [Oscillospiraceae bacterium]
MEVSVMLRMAEEADVPQILEIYAPYILTTTYSFEYEVPTLEEFEHRFRSVTAQFPWLVWEENGRVVGYAYGSAPFERAAYSWCAEASVYLRPEARGRGIGKKLYTALEKILTAQGYRTVYAIITSENTASAAFHRKMGYGFLAEFQNCGYKFGRWLGVIWMEKRLLSVENVRNFPTSCRGIGQNEQKFSDILDNLSLS